MGWLTARRFMKDNGFVPNSKPQPTPRRCLPAIRTARPTPPRPAESTRSIARSMLSLRNKAKSYSQAKSYRCRSRSANSSVKSRHCWGFRTRPAAVVIVNIARQWVAPYTVTRNPCLGQSGCWARSSSIIAASSVAVFSSFRDTRGSDIAGGLGDSKSTSVVIW